MCKRFLLLVLAILAVLHFSGEPTKQAEQRSYAQRAFGLVTDLSSHTFRVFNLKNEVNRTLSMNYNRNYTKLSEVPLSLQQAIIATEDNRFYRHQGVDLEGIARATLVNLQDGRYSEGGSTITQQLVKNLFLSSEKTLARKVEEALLAVSMEFSYSKEEILEMYLNTIYFGSGATGIGNAAHIYFAKPAKELTLSECTLLAGLPNAPSLYSPFENYQAARQRQSIVLDNMVRYGFISPGMAKQTYGQTLALTTPPEK